MRRVCCFIFFSLVTLVGAGCKGRSDTLPESASQTTNAVTDSDRVFLRAKELPPEGDVRVWRLGMSRGDSTAVFDFAMRMPPSSETRDSPVPMVRGKLRRVRGAHGQQLVDAIAHAFAADSVPRAVEKVDSLAITVGVLGTQLAHQSGASIYAGEFTADPPGDWIAAKLFLGDGETEVFLAINPRTGEAQLFAKDPEYANAIVREFARILL
jgi:hypothetical protein